VKIGFSAWGLKKLGANETGFSWKNVKRGYGIVDEEAEAEAAQR
jgi:hypothetical protein